MAQENSLNFTIDSLGKLPVPLKGLACFKDIQNPTLQLYVTPNGAKTFFFRRRIAGRDRRVKIGRFPTLSIAQARSRAILLAADAEKGIDPIAERRRAEVREITLKEQCANYIEFHCKKRNKGWQKQEKEIARYLKPLLNKPLSTITREQVETLHLKIGSSAPIMANRVMALLRSVFNYSIKKGWEGRNPAQAFERFKETSRDRFVLPQEMPFLLQAIECERRSLIRDFFKILLFTGVRKGNVQQMRWEQIDWNFGYWRIPDTKNGQPLIVPLSEKALEVLTERRINANSFWVFPQTKRLDKPIVSPQKCWNRIKARASLSWWKQDSVLLELSKKFKTKQVGDCKLAKVIVKQAEKAGIVLPGNLMDIRIHDLRRTFGSYQALTGASLPIIGKSLGHKSLAATQIYARMNLGPVRESVEKATRQMLIYSA